MTVASAAGGTRVPLQVSRGSVIASVQVDLTPEVIQSLQDDVLELLRDSRASGLVIDVGGMEMLDPQEFSALRRVAKMAQLLGARPILSGFRPGVVSALMDLDVDVTDVEATRTTDDALDLIRSASEPTAREPNKGRRLIDDQEWDEADDSDPI